MKSIQFSYQRSKMMAQPEYKLKTARSREDYQFFHVVLMKYDPQYIKDIYVNLAPQQLIRSQEKFAEIILKTHTNNAENQENYSTQPLSINYSGRIDSIAHHFQQIELGGKTLYHLKQPQKKGNLSILSFRECDHTPREETFLNSNFIGQSTKKKSYSNAVAICDICQVTLWKYYDKEQIQISLRQLCKVNSIVDTSQMINEFSWSIALNEQFTQTTQIGKIHDQEINLPYLAKASFLLDFDEHRKKIKESTIIIKLRRVICKHEKILEDRCQFCMQQVKQEHLNQFTSYLFQNETNRGNVLVTGSILKQHEEMFIESLLSNNKAMIILDLDNTILHSNQISQLDLKNVMALKEFYLIPKIQCPYQEQKGKRDLIVVKMRPFFKHFIYVITKLFEIYVYTKGTRVYAQEICKYIRAQYAGQQRTHPYLTWEPEKLLFLQNKKSFTTNIISRDEDSNLESKSFDKILPSKTQYHLILDDRRDVWNNSPSWFFTREYYYFLKKVKKSEENASKNDDISHYLSGQSIQMPEIKGELIEEFKNIKLHYPEKKDMSIETNDKVDYFLLFAAYALKRIHKNFFEAIKADKLEKQQGQKSEMKEQNHNNATRSRKFNKINLAYQYAKTKYFFKNTKMVLYLGQDQNQNNNNTVRRAKKMGAIFSDDNPKMIIRANDLMKQTKKPDIFAPPVSSPPNSQIIEELNANYYYNEKKELNEWFNKKYPVVSESWIHYCYQFNYPFSWEEFKLYDPFQIEVNHEDFAHVIEREAKLILNTFEQEMAKDLAGDHKKQVHSHSQSIRHKKEKKQCPVKPEDNTQKSS